MSDGLARLSHEHAEYRWVTVAPAEALLTASDPTTQWTVGVIRRAEVMRRHLSPALRAFYQAHGFETGSDEKTYH